MTKEREVDSREGEGKNRKKLVVWRGRGGTAQKKGGTVWTMPPQKKKRWAVRAFTPDPYHINTQAEPSETMRLFFGTHQCGVWYLKFSGSRLGGLMTEY